MDIKLFRWSDFGYNFEYENLIYFFTFLNKTGFKNVFKWWCFNHPAFKLAGKSQKRVNRMLEKVQAK